MLEMILLTVGFTAIIFVAYKYGKRDGIEEKRAEHVGNIEFFEKEKPKTIKYKDHALQQTSELLFLLTDFMHDAHVFEVFTHEEINELFVNARMVTRYNELSTIEDVIKLIERLRQHELTRLYPGYYESLSKTNSALFLSDQEAEDKA